MTKTKFSLNAAQLRLLALGLMLVDHVGRTLFPAQTWMVCLGRLAFPIFAFQTAEGYRHTRNFRGYCVRLAVFALISEIPFDLMLSGSPFYPYHQNVMVTLLLGLLACRAYDRKHWLLLPCCFLAGLHARCDYGAMGVLVVLAFHIFRDQKLPLLLMLTAINWFGYDGPQIAFGFLHVPLQAFAALAFFPIVLYNGKKGGGGKWLQYGSYLFYPLHLLILGLL